MARDIADAKLRYELALIEGSAVRSAVVDSAGPRSANPVEFASARLPVRL